MKDNRMEVMAYNMKIIQAIWKYVKHGFGDTQIRGNEYNTKSFYGTFERSRQTIREIVNCEFGYNHKSVDKWAKRIEVKTGIPYVLLTGEEKIVLSNGFDAKYFPKYAERST